MKRMGKAWLAGIMLCSAMVATACSQDEETANGKKEDAVTLTIGSWRTEDTEGYKKVIEAFEKKNPEIAEILTKFDNILGIKINEENSGKQDIPKEILDLIDKRRIEDLFLEYDVIVVRENKEWNKSDELRDLINQKGYDIKDTKQGTEIKKR